jgi:hypothetical protein
LTPVSTTATVTPLPVEYCQALLMLSIAKPGAVSPIFGSATVIARAQMLLCRMGCSGSGTPLSGTAAGSTDGGSIAMAFGALDIIAVSTITEVAATTRLPPRHLIAFAPR